MYCIVLISTGYPGVGRGGAWRSGVENFWLLILANYSPFSTLFYGMGVPDHTPFLFRGTSMNLPGFKAKRALDRRPRRSPAASASRSVSRCFGMLLLPAGPKCTEHSVHFWGCWESGGSGSDSFLICVVRIVSGCKGGYEHGQGIWAYGWLWEAVFS